MMSINKKFLAFALTLTFGLLIAGGVSAVSWLPLVPCGTSAQGYTPCTFCEILHLTKNIYDFLTFEITPALASVMVAVAGFFILTAGDSTTRLETGKNILKSVVISLLIIYSSWLVINTALTIFAKPTGGGGFFSFTCQAPPPPGTLNNTGGNGGSDRVCAKANADGTICSSQSCSKATDCTGSNNLCIYKNRCPSSTDCRYSNPDYASACVKISGIAVQVQQDKPYMRANTPVIPIAVSLGGTISGALGYHSSSSFHQTGCALDFSGFSQSNACSFMQQAGNIVGSSHIRNEYSFNCPGYPSNPSSQSTGGHVHVTTCSVRP